MAKAWLSWNMNRFIQMKMAKQHLPFMPTTQSARVRALSIEMPKPIKWLLMNQLYLDSATMKNASPSLFS